MLVGHVTEIRQPDKGGRQSIGNLQDAVLIPGSPRVFCQQRTDISAKQNVDENQYSFHCAVPPCNAGLYFKDA